jgi:hypothetical protein
MTRCHFEPTPLTYHQMKKQRGQALRAATQWPPSHPTTPVPWLDKGSSSLSSFSPYKYQQRERWAKWRGEKERKNREVLRERKTWREGWGNKKQWRVEKQKGFRERRETRKERRTGEREQNIKEKKERKSRGFWELKNIEEDERI